MINLDDYKRKIAIILDNRLQSGGDNDFEIQNVHIWLTCEWQCTDMSDSDRIHLDNFIDEFASAMIRMF